MPKMVNGVPDDDSLLCRSNMLSLITYQRSFQTMSTTIDELTVQLSASRKMLALLSQLQYVSVAREAFIRDNIGPARTS